MDAIASTSANPIDDGPRQIAIKLSTKDTAYSIPSTKFLVPSNWRRFHLSELINKVLENSSAIPFDFLISSTLLRSSLADYCASSGTSEEVTLEIEYLPSTLPPQLESTLPAEDWVSDISLSLPSAILTSSYAGTLSLHSSTRYGALGEIGFNGHDLSVLSCCYVDHPERVEGRGMVASGGMDRVARVWEYDNSLNPTTLPIPSTLYLLNLHKTPISSIRSHRYGSKETSSPHLLTGSWDGVIGVWDLTKGVNEGEPGLDEGERKKKRKKLAPGMVIGKSPVSVLTGHTGKISRVIFDHTDRSIAYSASHDHSIRSWDLSNATETLSKTSDKVPLCLAQMASPNLLATGSTDRTVSLWDLRESTKNISLNLPGHLSQVSCVAAHPTSELLLASGSFDSTVRIWDARSVRQALFVIPLPPKQDAGEVTAEKILAIDWDGEKLVAGGEGARVVVWKVSGSKEVEVLN